MGSRFCAKSFFSNVVGCVPKDTVLSDQKIGNSFANIYLILEVVGTSLCHQPILVVFDHLVAR